MTDCDIIEDNLSPSDSTEEDDDAAARYLHPTFTPLPGGRIKTSVLDEEGHEIIIGYEWMPTCVTMETPVDPQSEIRPVGVQPTFIETVTYGSRGGG